MAFAAEAFATAGLTANVRKTAAAAHRQSLQRSKPYRSAHPFQMDHCQRTISGLDKVLLPLHGRRTDMLYYALVFLIIGLIAGVLGISGVAAVASQIAWVLFLIGVILLVVHLVTGNRQRPVL
jgi:uncharacterized membrane protein YtjA (UPF0391 family)